MTVKEYLSQAYRLENKIKLQQKRIEELRELATSVSSPGFEEHYNASRNTDAPYVETLEKIMEYQEETEKRIALLLDLREQMRASIQKVENPDLSLVLEYRYIYNMPWSKIGDEMYVDERTVRRWHNQALACFKVPKNPIVI